MSNPAKSFVLPIEGNESFRKNKRRPMSSTASSLVPAGLSSEDVIRAQRYIEQTRDGLLGSTKLLTSAQWEFKPGPERWSIAEIVEHVAAVQERVIARIQQNLASAPPPPPEQNCEVVDIIVISQIPVRLSKFPSPIPVERRFDHAGAVRRYTENCAALSEMLTSTPGLRDHALESAPLKAISKGAYSVMDGYQWILAAAAHAERHTKQVLEVIADCAFPV
jgi:hypothetical protein